MVDGVDRGRPAGWRGPGLTQPPQEFARHAGELAPDVKVRILSPGETLELDQARICDF
jgi:hypothetical protein